jgi:hypothetical protein
MMGWFDAKPEKTTFRKAVERTREALEEAESRASTTEEWINIASAWEVLVTELNPVMMDKPEGKKDD